MPKLTKWIFVIIFTVSVLLIGAAGKIPFFDRTNYPTSEERRTKFQVENTPAFGRAEAIALVTEFILLNCDNGTSYIESNPRFDAIWMRNPFLNDHNIRSPHEWTITDPVSGTFWRFYEDTYEIVTKYSKNSMPMGLCVSPLNG